MTFEVAKSKLESRYVF